MIRKSSPQDKFKHDLILRSPLSIIISYRVISTINNVSYPLWSGTPNITIYHGMILSFGCFWLRSSHFCFLYKQTKLEIHKSFQTYKFKSNDFKDFIILCFLCIGIVAGTKSKIGKLSKTRWNFKWRIGVAVDWKTIPR